VKSLVAFLASMTVLIVAVQSCHADTTTFDLKYLNHWDNQPQKPDVFATGKLNVSFPHDGTNIKMVPFTTGFNVKMTANYQDDTGEWGHAAKTQSGGCSVYSFASQLDGGQWETKPQNGPDSFTTNPNGANPGEWQCNRKADLTANAGQHSLRLELYVSCCCCRYDYVAHIRPPRGYANLVVSATIQWTVDANGLVSNSGVVNFQLAQSLHVDTAPVHARRGDNGWDCGNRLFAAFSLNNGSCSLPSNCLSGSCCPCVPCRDACSYCCPPSCGCCNSCWRSGQRRRWR